MARRTHLQDVRGGRRRERGASKQIYNSVRWRRIRMIVLSRSPMCVMCGTALAEHVDHIVDIEAGGSAFDLANLQSLCASCHGKKTAGKI